MNKQRKEENRNEMTTYMVLNDLRDILLYLEYNIRGYDDLDDLFKTAEENSSRYVPGSGEKSAALSTKRTKKAIYSQKRFRFIKSTTEHKYMFTPKPTDLNTAIFADGIYVLETRNNSDSGLKFGDNIAENRFDITEQDVKRIPVSSVNDITPQHINYVKRKFGPYLGLAVLYIAVAEVAPFTSANEVGEWITNNYKSSVDNIYKYGCMKLFQTGTDPRELKALMCAAYLGEKFASKSDKDILTSILDRFNNLTPVQQPKFITGLSPEEYERVLKAYNVTYNPTYVGEEWNHMRDEIMETFCSIPLSNKMNPVPESDHIFPDNMGRNSDNITHVNISQVIKYLKGLGYDGINIVDFSCRVNPELSEEQMNQMEEAEILTPRESNTEWGGMKRRTKQRRNNNHKTKKRRNNKIKKRV